jgi:type IX secretion system PorP/SprF family membrane protein
MFKSSILILMLSGACVFAQTTQDQLYNNFSSHNFLKHNRFFVNPTFSVARENTTALSFLSRNKFSDFDDSPQLYVGSYSGRISEKVGVGIGVFQQNFGIFKNFGVLLNYGYQVRLSDKNALAFGFNFMYSRNGIDRSRIVVSNPDPFITNFQERSVVNFQPAINLTLGDFDTGFFMENLIDYDLRSYDFITSSSEKTFSGHLMYTKRFGNGLGVFRDGKFQLLSVLRKRGRKDPTLTGSLLLDLPKIGWLQGTYDDLYGAAFGIGFNISEKIAIGFVYEKGKNDLGITNEISLTYSFGKYNHATIIENLAKVEITESLNELADLERNKNELKVEKIEEIIDTYKIRQDSIYKIQKKEAQRKNLQLLQLIKSNQQNRPVEIVSNRKNSTLEVKKSEKPKVFVKNKIVAVKKETKKSTDQVQVVDKLVVNKTGVLKGYYVVANYYSKESNAKLFTQNMKINGFNAKYFKHPVKNNYYVYLDVFSTNSDAQKAVVSKLNNRYNKLLAIVKVSSNRLVTIPIKPLEKEQNKVKIITPKIVKKKNKKPASIRKMKSTESLSPGYYLVVNVFSKKSYANAFINKLDKKGLNPKFFISSQNNYRYVYLSKVETKNEALELYYSNLNGNYTADKWIMHIE